MGTFINSPNDPIVPTSIDYEQEREAILRVIENESAAIANKKLTHYANYWVHAPYVRTIGIGRDGKVTVVKGWKERAVRTQEYMRDYPEPYSQNLGRKNFNLRIYQDAAWVTFDQYGYGTNELEIVNVYPGMIRADSPDISTQGLSRETRFLEKHDGVWKIAYVGRVLVDGTL
ncbi:MAG: hypothetical protein AAGE93_11775 [Bacteroidota bacterium]